MRPHGVSAARQKKGIFGRVRAKAGQYVAVILSEIRRRVPAGSIDVMSLWRRLPGTMDHDFVIKGN
jgi:hypothetical protein